MEWNYIVFNPIITASEGNTREYVQYSKVLPEINSYMHYYLGLLTATLLNRKE